MTGKEFQEWLARNSVYDCSRIALNLNNLSLDTVRRWKVNGTPDKHAEWFKRHDQEARTAPTPPSKHLAAAIPVTKQEATRQDGYRDVFVGTQIDQELYEQGEEYIRGVLESMVEAPVLPLGLASLRQLIASLAKDVEESFECLDNSRDAAKNRDGLLDTMHGEAAELAFYAAMVAAACSNMLAEEEA